MQECIWIYTEYENYKTSCGKVFHFEYDGLLEDSDFKFCPYCGAVIKQRWRGVT